MEVENLVRKNILGLKPYSSARDEFKGEAKVFLDANENPFGSPLDKNYNRYPDPLQLKLKQKISSIKGIPTQHIFLGNGSDEPIDLLFRVFCEPGVDNVIVCPPTYGMYSVAADINNVELVKVNLTPDFQLDVPAIMDKINEHTKMLFICSPNNPSGNSMHYDDIEFLLNNFLGIVVVDEAYINYSKQRSLIRELTEYENLVILQTFSKAWGLAGLRLGMAFSTSVIIDLMNKVKPPYNINDATAGLALEALDKIDQINLQIKETVEERQRLSKTLEQIEQVEKVYPSDANFILVKFKNADDLYAKLLQNGIVVRSRTKVEQCEGCLRITVGTKEENTLLIDAIRQIYN